MSIEELQFPSVNLEDDTIYIPFFTGQQKGLHMLVPTLFPPYFFKIFIIYIQIFVTLVICLSWINKKSYDVLLDNSNEEKCLLNKVKKNRVEKTN